MSISLNVDAKALGALVSKIGDMAVIFFVVTGGLILLVDPDPAGAEIEAFREDYASYLWVVFVTSGCLSVYRAIELAGRRRAVSLGKLIPDEARVLLRFLDEGRSVRLHREEPGVRSLVSRGVIENAQDYGSFTGYYEYTIPNWAWDRLDKKRRAVEQVAGREARE